MNLYTWLTLLDFAVTVAVVTWLYRHRRRESDYRRQVYRAKQQSFKEGIEFQRRYPS